MRSGSADLAALAQVWAQTRIAPRLDDPKLGRTRRMEEARAALQGHVNPLALNLVLLLVERGRAGLVPQIAAAFDRLERERERRVTAHVTSAIPLTDAQRSDLRTTAKPAHRPHGRPGETGRSFDYRRPDRAGRATN